MPLLAQAIRTIYSLSTALVPFTGTGSTYCKKKTNKKKKQIISIISLLQILKK